MEGDNSDGRAAAALGVTPHQPTWGQTTPQQPGAVTQDGKLRQGGVRGGGRGQLRAGGGDGLHDHLHAHPPHLLHLLLSAACLQGGSSIISG